MKTILADVFKTINDIGKEKTIETDNYNFSVTIKYLLHFENSFSRTVTLDQRTSHKNYSDNLGISDSRNI